MVLQGLGGHALEGLVIQLRKKGEKVKVNVLEITFLLPGPKR